MVEISKNPNADASLLQKLEELRTAFRSSGLGDMHSVSSALVKMGLLLRSQPRIEAAQEMSEAALELWPNNIDAYRLRARLQLDNGILGLPGAAWTGMIQISKQFSDFWRAFFALHRFMLWLAVVAVSTLLLWIFNWTIAYYRLWCHDLAESFSSLPTWLSFGIGAAIPLLPIILGLGLIWSIALLLILIWPYTSRGEKGILVLTTTLFMALPNIIHVMSAASALYDQRMAHILVYNQGGEEWNDTLWNDLSNEANKNPRDPIPSFMLGNLYYESRCYFDSADRYQQATTADRSFAQAINNNGNSLYQQGNTDGAIVKYQEAKRMDPDLCSPLLNLNLAFNEKFEFDAAAKEISQARLVCPEIVSKSVPRDISRVDKHDAVLQEYLNPKDQLLDMFLASLERDQYLLEDLWPTSLIGIELPSIVFVSIGLLVAFFIRSSGSKMSHKTRYCLKCAQPTCPKCQLPQTSELYCGQCTRLFILRSGIDAQVQKDGIVRTNRLVQNSETRAKILSFILPGSGHYLAGRKGTGLFLLSLWGIVGGLWMRPELEVFSYLDVTYAPVQIFTSVLLILTASVWALANLFIPFHE